MSWPRLAKAAADAGIILVLVAETECSIGTHGFPRITVLQLLGRLFKRGVERLCKKRSG
jgi:hypothetical protein